MPARRYRLQAENIFLTYPQCETTPAVCLSRIAARFPAAIFIVVGREKHKDGNWHLHAAFSLVDKVNYQNSHWADEFGGKHGKFEGARNMPKCVGYCVKDGLFVASGIDPIEYVRAAKLKQSTVSATIALRLTSGESIRDVNEDTPGYVLLHLVQLQRYQEWGRLTLVEIKTWNGVYLDVAVVPHNGVLVQAWLNANIRKTREHKQEQLWLWSRHSNMGKTTMLNLLSERLRIFYIPTESNWDNYEDNRYDLMVADDFAGSQPLAHMNLLLEGSPFCMKQRYQSTVKKDRLPVIICSNYPPRECYSRLSPVRISNLETRLLVIELTSFVSIRLL